MKTVVITLKNDDVYEFEPGTYDRYTFNSGFFSLYLENSLVSAFSIACIAIIDIVDKENGGFYYD